MEPFGLRLKTHGEKVYSNFRGLNVPEDGVECESFTVFLMTTCSYDNKYYLQIYLDNCA